MTTTTARTHLGPLTLEIDQITDDLSSISVMIGKRRITAMLSTMGQPSVRLYVDGREQAHMVNPDREYERWLDSRMPAELPEDFPF